MQCIDVLIAGPPAFESPEAWPTDRLEDWGADSVKWLRSLLPPKTPLYSAHLHTDETSPHVHPAFPPALADAKGVVALSWKRMQAYMAESAAARPIKGGPAQLRALQDSYFREVGQKYGLERGKVGAQIEYAPLDRTEGLKRRVSGAEARAAEEQQRRTEAEKRATDSDAARRQAAAAAVRERELRLETERRTERRTAAEAEKRVTDSDAARRQAAAAAVRERELRLETERRTAAELAREREIRTAAERAANSAVTRADQLEADAERRAAAADRKTAATEAAAAKDRAVLEHRVDREAERADAAESRTADAQRRADAAAEKTAATEAAAAKRRTVLERRVDREAKRADAAESKTADAQRHAAAADQDSSILRDTVQEYKIARSTERRRHQAAEAKTDRDRTTERHWTAATAARAGRQGYGQTPAPQIGQAPTRPTDRSHTPARRRQRGRGQIR